MKKKNDINRFALLDYDFTAFEPGMRVADIGCGKGGQLQKLAGRGCRAIGMDPNLERLRMCADLGLEVVAGHAEQMPFPGDSCDGVICKGVIPFTCEPLAFREIARVLRPGGTAQLACLGSGFYLRLLVLGSGGRVKQRLYGLKTFLNTWLFALTGRVLPGFLGDTVYQSRRLQKYYGANRMILVRETPSKTFLGLPVFIYHRIQTTRVVAQPVPAAETIEEVAGMLPVA
jgi:ubiquinone/menaquinone biosynthesis C-methylase UbiE